MGTGLNYDMRQQKTNFDNNHDRGRYVGADSMLHSGPKVHKISNEDIQNDHLGPELNYLKSSPSRSSLLNNDILRNSKSPRDRQGSDYNGLRMKSNNDRSLSYHSRGSAGILLGDYNLSAGTKTSHVGNEVYRSPTFVSQTYETQKPR